MIYIILLSHLLKLLSVYYLDRLDSMSHPINSFFQENTHSGGLDFDSEGMIII